jgi:hypothetical protein
MAMDAMSQREAEWGTMSISAPQLANPGTIFQFNLSEGPENFYNDAKNQIQGRAAEFQQSINSFGLGVNFSLDTSVAMSALAQVQQFQQATAQSALQQSIQNQKQAAINSAALAQYNQAMATAATQDPAIQQQTINTAIQNLQQQMITTSPTTQPFPSLPTPTTAPSNQVTRPSELVSQFASPAAGQAFTQFQQLASNPTAPVISDRDAMISAAGDNAVKAMFSVLGDPKLADTFRSKRVLFGVVNVSVNPGWRTKKNYAADVAMETNYDDVAARASVYEWFINNPRVPVKCRLRVAMDQSLTFPKDHLATQVVADALDCLIEKIVDHVLGHTSSPREITLEDLSDSDQKKLQKTIGDPPIPPQYAFDASSNGGPLVSAVAPMTATQNLQLQSSYRNQQEVALQIALQMQLMGQTVAANAFERYAKNLQQDFATATVNVTANSYSTAGMFGFQVGPQLRAIEQAQAGAYSGPAQVLERQSFPALIIFGFEANDITPKLRKNEDGKYELREKQVHLLAASNWVPTDDRLYGDRSRPSETERFQLEYWINKYQARLAFADIPSSMNEFIGARVNAAKDRMMGSGCHFSLPQEIIAPPTHPKVTQIQPAMVDASTTDPITVLLAGQDLDSIDLTQIGILGGGTIQPGTAQLLGNAISLQVKLSSPSRLIFQLPTISGDVIYTAPQLVAITGEPSVANVTPDTLTLSGNAGAVVQLVTVAISGENLDRINSGAITPTTDKVAIDKTKTETHGKNVILVTLSVPHDVHAFALKLPITNQASRTILTPPIMFESGPLVLEHQVGNNKNSWSNERLVFPQGTTLGALQTLLGQGKSTTSNNPNNAGGGGGGQGGGGGAAGGNGTGNAPAAAPAVAPPAAAAPAAPAPKQPPTTNPSSNSGGATYNTNVIVAPSGGTTANAGAPASNSTSSGSSKPSSQESSDPSTQPAVLPTPQPWSAPTKQP